jgi:hypothetical protein
MQYANKNKLNYYYYYYYYGDQRRMRWAGHVVRTKAIQNAELAVHKTLIKKPES